MPHPGLRTPPGAAFSFRTAEAPRLEPTSFRTILCHCHIIFPDSSSLFLCHLLYGTSGHRYHADWFTAPVPSIQTNLERRFESSRVDCRAAERAMSEGWNVLIVEKDGEAAKQIATRLKSIRANVRIALDGQEAILFTGERAPDLIITEIDLPMLNGLETRRFLKTKFSGRTVPVLVSSGRRDEHTVESSADIGFEEFIGKPTQMDELVDSVVDLLALGKAENELFDFELPKAAPKRGSQPEEDESSKLIEQICSLRAAVAERLLARGFSTLVPQHLDRMARLDPDNARLDALRAQLK